MGYDNDEARSAAHDEIKAMMHANIAGDLATILEALSELDCGGREEYADLFEAMDQAGLISQSSIDAGKKMAAALTCNHSLAPGQTRSSDDDRALSSHLVINGRAV